MDVDPGAPPPRPTDPAVAARPLAPDGGTGAETLPAPSSAPPSSGSKLPRRKRISMIVVPVLAIVVFGVWWFAFRSSGGSSAAATTATATATTKQLATVTRGPMNDTVSAEGTVAAAQTDDLSFASAGTVTAVNVKAGDTVAAGEVLATIDFSALQAAVTSANSNLATAKAKLSNDETAGTSSAQITADQAIVTSANDALTTAYAAFVHSSLAANFNGTVAAVNITVGEQLSSGGSGGTSTTGSGSGSGQSSASIGSGSASRLGASTSSSSTSTAQIQVVSNGDYTVQLAVDSTDITTVAVGQAATLTLSSASSAAGGGFGGRGGGFGGGTTGGTTATTAAPRARAGAATATATVTGVSKVATATSGVATYPVTISFKAPSTSFYVGSTVIGAITTAARPNVIQVPARAVTTVNGVSTVVLTTNGKLDGPTETRTVTTGATSNGQIEITKGLQVGDKVIETLPNFAALLGRGGTGTGGGGFGGGGTRTGTNGAGG